MAKPHVIDYNSFLPKQVSALRKAWQEVRAQRPGETFYLFGIETDSDLTDLYPLCNTEEQYAADGGTPKPSLQKWEMDDDATLYRAGKKHTNSLAHELNRYVFEDHCKDPKGADLNRKRQLLRVFENALVELDREGCFGTGKARHKAVLQIAFVDPSPAERKHMLKVIKRINPPESTSEFFSLVQKAETEQATEKLGEEAVIQIASEFLRREKRSFDRCEEAYPVRNEAIFPSMAKLLGLKEIPREMWQLFFLTKGASRRTIVVIVDPATGRCAVEPDEERAQFCFPIPDAGDKKI
jgi:hypothetical protein